MSHSRRRVVVASIALAGTLLIILLPPYVLLLTSTLPLDWQLLSAVGQSYTGVSAILGALAIIAAILTFRASLKQVDEAARMNMRTMQFQLRLLSLQDADLAEAVAPPSRGARDHSTFRQVLYVAMWLNYYENAYKSGLVSGQAVTADCKHFLLSSNAGRDYWRIHAMDWQTSAIFPFAQRAYEEINRDGDT